MRWLRFMACVGAGAGLGLAFVSSAAFAADPAQKATVATTAPTAASSQTASLGPTNSAAVVTAAPLNLDLDAFRFDQAPKPNADASLTTPSNPTLPSSLEQGAPAARFEPMVKSSSAVIDPMNRGSFFDNHELGIQLKKDF